MKKPTGTLPSALLSNLPWAYLVIDAANWIPGEVRTIQPWVKVKVVEVYMCEVSCIFDFQKNTAISFPSP